ncbi:MAG: GcrA family cell cycle regulator [Stellaceae bacterium]
MEITWTTERVERLTQLFEEGLPTAEIGRRLGLTKNAVIGRLYRSAMTRREPPPKIEPRRNVFEFAGPSCLWPHGHPNDPNFHFCGARPMAGKPYCEAHAALAYIRPKDQNAA